MASEQLKATSISVGFGKIPIVGSIDLALDAGEIVVIAGPNGVGKSTLIRAMARQLKPLSGTVTLDGNEIWSLSPAQFARQVAYVPQTLEPGQDMTVEEIVALGRNPHQQWWQWYGGKDDKEAVDNALTATQMLELRGKYLSQLSGGERQRACMATALAQAPRFMILDEPTSHLDFRHQLDLVSQLKELRTRSIGCLIVLHDLNVISRIADRVVLLHRVPSGPSAVTCIDTPDKVLTRDNLAAVFEVDVHIFKDPETGTPIYNPERVI